MNGIQAMLNRAREAWTSFSFNQKAIVGMVALATVVSVLIFGLWLGKEDMAVLFSNLSPVDSAEILDEVTKMGGKAEVSGNGGTILVPSGDVLRLRNEMARKGLPSEGGVGFEIFDEKNLGMTDFLQNVNYQRATEGELARSIGAIEGVRRARVHITAPRKSLYLKDQRPGTASVLLSLDRRRSLGGDQINGIQHLVASAVDGLEASKVMVIDESGSLLSRSSGDEVIDLTHGQLGLQKQVEEYLAGKASDMLLAVLGPGRSVVRVNAEIDFDRVERVSQSFDPTAVPLSEEQSSSTNNGTGDSNEKLTTNYEVGKTVETVLDGGGGVEKLTVSVFVDGEYEADDSGALSYAPRSTEDLTNIQNVVAAALGIDAGRGDQIQVVNMQFQSLEFPEPSVLEGPWVQRLPDLVGRVLLFAIAAGLILSLRKTLVGLARDASRPTSGSSDRRGATPSFAAPTPGEARVDEQDWSEVNPDEVANLIRAFASQRD